MSHIEEAIRQWEANRAGTISELENIPEEAWDHRPDSDARSVREIARHIAEMGVAFTDELLSDKCSFRRIQMAAVQEQPAADLPEAHAKADLLDLLRTTGEQNAQRLREKGKALADETMQTSAGTQSRLAGLWFAISHEWYHRGQLTAYARELGHTPALTQQIEAMRTGG